MAAILNVLASNRQSLENLRYTIGFICFYHSDWTGVEILDDKQRAKNTCEKVRKYVTVVDGLYALFRLSELVSMT